jgi:hypothetical protein
MRSTALESIDARPHAYFDPWPWAQTASSSLPKFFVDLVGHDKSSLADELREECRVVPRTRPHVHDRRPWKDPTSLEAARVQTR